MNAAQPVLRGEDGTSGTADSTPAAAPDSPASTDADPAGEGDRDRDGDGDGDGDGVAPSSVGEEDPESGGDIGEAIEAPRRDSPFTAG